MIKRILGAITLSVLAGSFAFSQEKVDSTDIETVTLTLDQAVEYALSNSRTLKSNDIDLEIKKRASDVSWNVFFADCSNFWNDEQR